MSVGEGEVEAGAVFSDADKAMPQMQAVGSMGQAQYLLQVGAVNAEIGRAETGAIGALQFDWKRCDAGVVSPATPDHFPGLGGLGGDGVEAAEPVEFACGVGR